MTDSPRLAKEFLWPGALIVVGLLGTALVSLIENQQTISSEERRAVLEIDAERARRETQLILDAVNVGNDPAQRIANLAFLARIGLITVDVAKIELEAERVEQGELSPGFVGSGAATCEQLVKLLGPDIVECVEDTGILIAPRFAE